MPASSLIPACAKGAYRTRDLAGWFNTTTQTIRNWSRLGLLPKPAKLGPRTWRYRVDHLRAFLKEREQRAADRGQGAAHA